MKSTQEIFDSFNEMHVLVIGDLMLDKYLYGNSDRISPEAPVPIVDVLHEECRLGGAANVALNCRALGAKVSIASVIGTDAAADELLQLLQNVNIDTHLLMRRSSRITTIKQRVIVRNQHLLRLDTEDVSELLTEDEHAFIDQTMRYIQVHKPDIVIFEDYNKGVLKAHVIFKIIEHCKLLNIPTAVDPKKNNFFAYTGVTIFKPNLKEVKEGLGLSTIDATLERLQEIHQALKTTLQQQISFITLSEHGVFLHDEIDAYIFPSYRRNIADVSGAGDTVIAVAAMTYVATHDSVKMAKWANVAGGLVCEKVGVVPIDALQLKNEITRLAL